MFVSTRQKVFVETIEPSESALTHQLATGTSIRTKSTRHPQILSHPARISGHKQRTHQIHDGPYRSLTQQ